MSQNTIRAMTGKDWDRALGLDRPEVRAAIEGAAAGFLQFFTKQCSATPFTGHCTSPPVRVMWRCTDRKA
jgi:hypothetical protein